MHKINERLFIGGLDTAVDQNFLIGNGITHVIGLCSDYSGARGCPVPYYHYHLVDGKATTDDELSDAVDLLTETMAIPDSKVLVHCLAGVSRSATVCALYLALSYGRSLDWAIGLVAKARPIVNPNRDLWQTAKRVIEKRRAGWKK